MSKLTIFFSHLIVCYTFYDVLDFRPDAASSGKHGKLALIGDFANMYATATWIPFKNHSTVSNPTMELYCFLLPITLQCRTTWQIANSLLFEDARVLRRAKLLILPYRTAQSSSWKEMCTKCYPAQFLMFVCLFFFFCFVFITMISCNTCWVHCLFSPLF